MSIKNMTTKQLALALKDKKALQNKVDKFVSSFEKKLNVIYRDLEKFIEDNENDLPDDTLRELLNVSQGLDASEDILANITVE